MPEYSIYQLRIIREKKLNELIDLGCQELTDVPSDFELNDYQQSQIISITMINL